MNITHDCRPLQHVKTIDSNHPLCWKRFTTLLKSNMLKKYGNYPDWCLFPMFYSYVLLDNKDEWNKYGNSAIGFGMVQLWKLTKGIYTFDDDVYDALLETGFKGDIPVDVLYRLPEWCVYIKTPKDVIFQSMKVHGIYVALDYNVESNDPQLVILYDTDNGFIGSTIYLTKGTTIEQSFNRTNEIHTNQKDELIVKDYIATTEKILPLIMYMCSEKPEYYSKNRTEPIKPYISKTKSGIVIKERSEIIPWDVAIRTGSILKKYKEEEIKHSNTISETGSRVRPHMRRAHWHGFWKGSKSGSQTFFLKWLLTTPVNMKIGDHTPVVKHDVD